MRDIMKFPEQIYVGTQQGAEFNTTEYPLAFATPFGTDKAFDKRKTTVDGWAAGGYYNAAKKTKIVTEVFNNDPLPGFQFEKAVSRYSTSNKMFRINDPRGFTLEIDSDNLQDILLNSAISAGDLQGEFVWGRTSKGSNFLTRIDHPDYVQYFANRNKPKVKFVPKVGEVINLSYSDKMMYLGKKYLAVIKESHTYKETGSVWGSRNTELVYHYHLSVTNDLHHVFLCVEEDNYYTGSLKVLKSWPAKMEAANIEANVNDYDLTGFCQNFDYGGVIKISDTPFDADKLKAELDLKKEFTEAKSKK